MKKENYRKRLLTKSLPWLKAKATEYFNAFIRDRDSDVNIEESFQCISCGQWKKIDRMNAGHYFPGVHSATKFDEDNVHAQCIRCNMHLHGNLIAYKANLILKIGQKRFDAITWKHSQRCKRDRNDYVELIMLYKNEC